MLLNFSRKPHDVLSKTQLKYRKAFLNDLPKYNFLKKNCLCGEVKRDLVCNVDRHAVNINFCLCKGCGIIYQSSYPDNKSIQMFYNEIQKGLYVGNEFASNEYFSFQQRRGKNLYDKWKLVTSLKKFNSILDIGCGAGGILYEFHSFKKQFGCDFNKNYIKFGLTKKLDLNHGDYKKYTNRKFDLILLIQVFEHFPDPVNELNKILKMQKIGGEIIIDIPSIESIGKVYGTPKKYFQFAHPFNYSTVHLSTILSNFGYREIFKEMNGLMIFKKIKIINQNKKVLNNLRKPSNYKNIKELLLKANFNYKYFISRRRFIDICKNYLKKYHLK